MPHAYPVADTIYAIYTQHFYLPKKVRAVINPLGAAFNGDSPWKRNLRENYIFVGVKLLINSQAFQYKRKIL